MPDLSTIVPKRADQGSQTVEDFSTSKCAVIAHACMYPTKIGRTSELSLSCANAETFGPFFTICWRTQAFTSVISGYGSRTAFAIVFKGVKPTPKLMSSTSCSMMFSTVGADTGGFSRILSKASAVNAQPFLYFCANAFEATRVSTKETTAALRSIGRDRLLVVGRIIFK